MRFSEKKPPYSTAPLGLKCVPQRRSSPTIRHGVYSGFIFSAPE
jgi:hypothetical protein